jgi:hypothetical protein
MRSSGSTSRTNSATDDRSCSGPAGLDERDRARVEDVVRVEELLDLLGQLGDRARVTFRAVLDVARNWRLATRAALANCILVPATAFGLLALIRRPPHGRRRVVVAVVCPGTPCGPPFTEIASDDVIRLFPTESSFDIGPFLRQQLRRAHGPREGELRPKRKTQEIPSQLGFSYRVSSVGCRLCVRRVASRETPRFVKVRQAPPRDPRGSPCACQGPFPLHPRPLNAPITNKTLLIK